jgi:hypothetical protein
LKNIRALITLDNGGTYIQLKLKTAKVETKMLKLTVDFENTENLSDGEVDITDAKIYVLHKSMVEPFK